jgi:RNA polymerase sigma factor (TIGR02999 family)
MPMESSPSGDLSAHDIAGITPDALFPIVYDELKRVARRQLRLVAAHATISTTELVHEAFLKLARNADPAWEGRAHFFGTAARAMRQVLVEFARRRNAAKRGGGNRPVTLSDAQASLQVEIDSILALDQALGQLDKIDARLRQVVELRFFAGLPSPEIAQLLGVTARTVERDWLKAKLILLREMSDET